MAKAVGTVDTVKRENLIEEKEVALACLKASIIDDLKSLDKLGYGGWENGYVYEAVAKKAAENAQEYIILIQKRIADSENKMWEIALEIEEMKIDSPEESEVEGESTVDTVSRENLVKFEVGKFYWASAGHRVIAVKRTAHYVTFNLFKVELEAGQNYFDAEAMTWLKASNIRAKVNVTGSGEACYIKGDENSRITILANVPIEIVGDEENVALTVDYKFDVEEEDDDDELIDPPEEVKVEETETGAEIADYQWKIDINRKWIEDAEVFIENTRNKYFFDEKTRNYLIESSKNEIAQSEKKIAEYEAAIAILKGVDNAASVDEVKVEETETDAESVEVETVVFKPVLHIGIEEMMKIPASELRKATDYNFWQNKIMEYEKEMASLKDGSALKESYEKTLEYYKDEMAKARKALYSVENGVEDDGSNDDDYDEEEITVYTPAVDDDDDDELIDPPEEVKVEKENAASVIEIPKEIEMAVELVTFAIERFNEGEVETAAAVVDTSVAEVPIVDEDAEIEKKRSEIAKYRANIDAINAKIAELENMRDEEFAKMEDIEDEISDMLWSAKETVMHIYNDKPIKQKKVLIGQDGSHHKVNPRKDYRISVDISDRNGLFTVTFLEGATSKYEFVAQYTTIKTFKAAMTEFGKAIERGDEEFAFPADKANTNK